MQRPRIRFERTDIWREGKWIDLWSVVHFLSGASVALGLSVFRFGFWPTFVIASALFIAYEFWEAMVKIEETPQNRFMDVIVGQMSFLTAWWIGIPGAWTQNFFIVFGAVLAINLVLAAFGWHASQKAADLERRMIARFEARRTRLRTARELRMKQREKARVSHQSDDADHG